MNTEYETVVEFSGLLSSGLPILIHLAVVAGQVLVASFFLAHGLACLFRLGERSAWVGRLGAIEPIGVGAFAFGSIQLALGAMVLAPVAVGAPPSVSRLALILAVGLLVGARARARTLRDDAVAPSPISPIGLGLRGLVLVAALVTLAFGVFEGADPAAQTRSIVTKAIQWRGHELGWQLAHDVDSPKVGDLAPDFVLEDPSGENSVQLASFRGKRPVALVFGSYT